jgi:hypothetical protein
MDATLENRVMANIEFNCPVCTKVIRGPADIQGKRVRCKHCQTVFQVPANAAVTAARPTTTSAQPKKTEAVTAIPVKKERDDELEGPAKDPYGVTHDNLAPRCPFCAMLMDPPDARICLHCGYDMVKRNRREFKETHEITAVDYLLYHVPTMLCFIGICIFLGLDLLMLLQAEPIMKDGWFDNGDGTWLVKPGIIPLYTFLFSMIFIVPMGRLIIKRLIKFTPPEITVKRKQD